MEDRFLKISVLHCKASEDEFNCKLLISKETDHNMVDHPHCNPLQGNYRVELLHREIPAVITGNEFTDYRVLKQPFKPCGMNCQFPVHITGTRTTISALIK